MSDPSDNITLLGHGNTGSRQRDYQDGEDVSGNALLRPWNYDQERTEACLSGSHGSIISDGYGIRNGKYQEDKIPSGPRISSVFAAF